MPGGIPSAGEAGIVAPNRDLLYARMCAFEEGALFTEADILEGDAGLRDEFQRLKGVDYVPVVADRLTRIIETRYLRRLPCIDRTMASYASWAGVELVDTGDRVAYKMRIKQYGPLEGCRYYSSGPKAHLRLSGIHMRIYPAPDWIRDESRVGRTLRAFLDTPQRDMKTAVKRAIDVAGLTETDLEDVIGRAQELAADPDLPEAPEITHHTVHTLPDILGQAMTDVREARA